MKMTNRKQMAWMAIALAFLLVIVPAGLASSVCTLMGFVTYPDGSAAKSGTGIRITDIDLGTTYDVQTGGKDWPYANFYLQSFTCNYGSDRIDLRYENTNQSVFKDFVYDHYPFVMNLTIPFTPETGDQESGGSSSGGGGGGSSGGSAGGGSFGGGGPVVSTAGDGGSFDFGTVIDQTSVNRLRVDEKFRLYIINDTRNIKMILGNVNKIGKDSMRVSFSTIKDEVVLKVNQPLDLDLDSDGSPDTRALVLSISGDEAYARFDRIYPKIKVPAPPNSTIGKENKSRAQHTESPMAFAEKDKDYALELLGMILIVLLLIIIFIDHRGKSREKGGGKAHD